MSGFKIRTPKISDPVLKETFLGRLFQMISQSIEVKVQARKLLQQTFG